MKGAALKNAPQSIQVLGKSYTVQFVDKVDEKDSMGEHEMTAQTLKVKKGLHPESAKETLLHEVIHAVDEQLDLCMREQQVHRLSIGLFQVLRENPAFLAYLTWRK